MGVLSTSGMSAGSVSRRCSGGLSGRFSVPNRDTGTGLALGGADGVGFVVGFSGGLLLDLRVLTSIAGAVERGVRVRKELHLLTLRLFDLLFRFLVPFRFRFC